MPLGPLRVRPVLLCTAPSSVSRLGCVERRLLKEDSSFCSELARLLASSLPLWLCGVHAHASRPVRRSQHPTC